MSERELLMEIRELLAQLDQRIRRIESVLGKTGREKVIAEEDGVRLIKTGDPFTPYIIEERIGKQVRIHPYKHLKTARNAFKFYAARARALH